MKIEGFDSIRDVAVPLEIEAALSKPSWRRNSFWLSHGAKKCPAINIMVNRDLAYVHYFPEGDHPGFASVGGLSKLSRGGITHFWSHASAEPYDLLNEAVVPFSSALKVAQKFANSSELPKCIAWRSLAGRP